VTMTTDLTPYSKKLALPADFDLVWRECEFRDMKPLTFWP
jgi:hypothetical protein